MNAMVEPLGWVLLHSLWQFAVIALGARLILAGLTRHSAATRFGVLVGALALMFLAPLGTWTSAVTRARTAQIEWTEQDRNSADPADEQTAASQAGDAQRAMTADAVAGIDAATRLDPRARAAAGFRDRSGPSGIAYWMTKATEACLRVRSQCQPWLPSIVLLWSAGVGFLGLRPLVGWRFVRQLRSVGVEPAPASITESMRRVADRLGIRRVVEVAQSARVTVPLVLGYFRPLIVLPVRVVTGLSDEQLEAILAHEMAHIRRHDFLVNLVQTLGETLFFYHPAIWWLSRQLRIERENCCDDLVVRVLANRRVYGQALVAVEELRGSTPLLALGASDGALLARIRRIIGGDGDTRIHRPWPVLVGGLGVASLAISLTIAWPLAAGTPIPPASEPMEITAAVNPPAKAFQERWSTRLDGPVTGTPAIYEDQLYVACDSGELVAFHLRDGRRLWSYSGSVDAQGAGVSSFRSNPCATSDSVYVGDETGELHAVDRRTGKRRWRFATEDAVRGATVADDKVLFGSYDKFVYAVHAKDGALLWKYETQSHVHAAPRVIGDEVLVAGCDGRLHVLELATGKLQRTFMIGDHLTATPAVRGDVAYVTSFSGEVNAVNWKTGQVQWKFSPPTDHSHILATPALTESLVLFGTQDHRLYAVDRLTGRKVWSFDTRAKILGGPLVLGEHVLTISEDGTLFELSLPTGELRSTLSLGQPATASPVSSNGLVVLSGEGGKVTGFADLPREEAR